MLEGLKEERFKEYITRGVNTYLSEYVDDLGFCYVSTVILTGDLRSARILVVGDGKFKDNDLAKRLNNDKNHIANHLKKVFSSKFLPKLNFIV